MQSSSWEVPELSALDTGFYGLTEHLVNSARRVTSEAELAVACMVGNDVAHVRGDADDTEPDLSSDPYMLTMTSLCHIVYWIWTIEVFYLSTVSVGQPHLKRLFGYACRAFCKL
jgi:hypothetical protein